MNLKKFYQIILIICIFILINLLKVNYSYANIDGTAKVGNTYGYTLKVRSEPNTNSKIKTELHPGDTVYILDRCNNNDWYVIQTKSGTTGYCYGSYLTSFNYKEKSSNKNIIGYVAIKRQQNKEVFGTISNANEVNVRKKQSVDSAILFKLKKGTKVTILNNNNPVKETHNGVTKQWYKIEYNNRIGYIFGQYISNVKKAKSNEYKNLMHHVAYSQEDASKGINVDTRGYYYLTKYYERVPLYKDSSFNKKGPGILPGEKLECYRKTDKYYVVKYNNTTYYVKKSQAMFIGKNEKFVEIDLSRKTLTLHNAPHSSINNKILTVNVGTNAPYSSSQTYTATRLGAFTIHQKANYITFKPKAWKNQTRYASLSSAYNQNASIDYLISKYWLAFDYKNGMHDANWSTINHYNKSHGCVQLKNAHIKELFNNVSIGTKVIVHF